MELYCDWIAHIHKHTQMLQQISDVTRTLAVFAISRFSPRRDAELEHEKLLQAQ
jgi:hypothetical protein